MNHSDDIFRMLVPGTIHLWRIDMSVEAERLQEFQSILSHEENERASRFCRDRDRTSFITARAAMRSILSRYLDIAPENVSFVYAPNGKPEISTGANALGLKFNLSHSRDYALLGVVLHSSIGVDIEFINQKITCVEIASRFFSFREANTLRSFPQSEQPAAFYSCWTRKEAYIKAIGSGMALALDSFEVGFGPGVPAALIRVEGKPQEPFRWTIYELGAPRNYAAAMAVQGRGHRLRQMHWSWK